MALTLVPDPPRAGLECTEPVRPAVWPKCAIAHAVHAKAANQLYDSVVDGYFARHKVKPGITGWAQINGWRGETDTLEKIQKRVQYDLEYIENWSVWFDAYILFMTPFALTKTENAY